MHTGWTGEFGRCLHPHTGMSWNWIMNKGFWMPNNSAVTHKWHIQFSFTRIISCKCVETSETVFRSPCRTFMEHVTEQLNIHWLFLLTSVSLSFSNWVSDCPVTQFSLCCCFLWVGVFLILLHFFKIHTQIHTHTYYGWITEYCSFNTSLDELL